MKTRMQEELAGSLTKLISINLENKHHHVQMTNVGRMQLSSPIIRVQVINLDSFPSLQPLNIIALLKNCLD